MLYHFGKREIWFSRCLLFTQHFSLTFLCHYRCIHILIYLSFVSISFCILILLHLGGLMFIIFCFSRLFIILFNKITNTSYLLRFILTQCRSVSRSLCATFVPSSFFFSLILSDDVCVCVCSWECLYYKVYVWVCVCIAYGGSVPHVCILYSRLKHAYLV